MACYLLVQVFEAQQKSSMAKPLNIIFKMYITGINLTVNRGESTSCRSIFNLFQFNKFNFHSNNTVALINSFHYNRNKSEELNCSTLASKLLPSTEGPCCKPKQECADTPDVA
jgi:hypothetical protein